MGITVNTSTQQITANVGETKIDVSVGGGVGPTGPQGPQGTLVMASSSVLGGVRIGSGVSIDVNGVITVSTAYAAVSHAHGFLSSSGTITDGAVSSAFVAAPAVVTSSGFLRQGQFGTSAGTIAQGNHTHDASVIVSGTLAQQRIPRVHTHDISVFTGTGAGNNQILEVLSAQLDGDQVFAVYGNGLVTIDAGELQVSQSGIRFAADNTVQTTAWTGSVAASDVTSGTFSPSRLPIATANAIGAVRIGSGVTITDGVISVSTNYAAATHSHAIGDVTGLQTALDGKQASGSYAAASHTHSPADVTFAATDRLLGRSSAGAGAGQEIVCTAAGRALLDDADAAAQRSTLGLGTAATAASGDFAAASHNQAWSTITSTPTTRAGYGITDAQKTITSGTAAPTGGADGDIYLQYTA